MEKADRYNLNQVIKVNITHYRTHCILCLLIRCAERTPEFKQEKTRRPTLRNILQNWPVHFKNVSVNAADAVSAPSPPCPRHSPFQCLQLDHSRGPAGSAGEANTPGPVGREFPLSHLLKGITWGHLSAPSARAPHWNMRLHRIGIGGPGWLLA